MSTLFMYISFISKQRGKKLYMFSHGPIHAYFLSVLCVIQLWMICHSTGRQAGGNQQSGSNYPHCHLALRNRSWVDQRVRIYSTHRNLVFKNKEESEFKSLKLNLFIERKCDTLVVEDAQSNHKIFKQLTPTDRQAGRQADTPEMGCCLSKI